MKNLHYLHYCYGKNELGKNNSYGNYLEKRNDKGDYQFNKYFFLFNIWWLARHRMYSMTLLYVIPVLTIFYYFVSISPADQVQNQEWFMQNIIFKSMPYLSAIHIFFCFVVFKALSMSLDIRFWKNKFNENCVRDKIKPLDYIMVPFVAGAITYVVTLALEQYLILII